MSKSWKLNTRELIEAVRAEHKGGSNPAEFQGVGTDSRQDLFGKIFFALKGESHDAHNYVEKAVSSGAAAIVVHEWREDWRPFLHKSAFFLVKDTLAALQALAHYWRRRHQFKVVAITGSNGKTTTKEIVARLLSIRYKVSAAKGSFNNHWGLPLSILAADATHTHLVLEMGMNHSGEVFRLCQIAEPNVVTVTTVGRAHMGELGSQAKVAEAKEEIYVSSPQAVHVFNIDNEWTMRMASHSVSNRQINVSSFNKESDVYLRAERMTWAGLDLLGRIGKQDGKAHLPMFGRHLVSNSMVAAGLALACDLSGEEIWRAFDGMDCTVWGRNQILSLKNGTRVIFDAYNSNPESFQILLKNAYECELGGHRFLVMGDMKELGQFSHEAHEEAGERAGQIGIDGVWYVGEFAMDFKKGMQKSGRPARVWLDSADVDKQLGEQFLSELGPDDVVLVKGSRGMRLERALEGWPLKTGLGGKD